jgi:hypothetical protein
VDKVSQKSAQAGDDVKQFEQARQREMEMGAPGDFRFSDVPKPENYLHTYRDLTTKDHLNMLTQLQEGTHRFLRSLFDENFMSHAQISTGFHYPVRSQYATLHMQLRVNSGSVCREDGRGIEVGTLIEQMQKDRAVFERDAGTLRYHVTENVKVSLLAAANEYQEQHGPNAVRQTSPLTFELGLTKMPTIVDDEEAESKECESSKGRADSKGSPEEGDDQTTDEAARWAEEGDEATNGPSSYLVNLQPAKDSAFGNFLYEKRTECEQRFGADPTWLYPFHVSVTGHFESHAHQIRPLVSMMRDVLADGGKKKVEVGNVICTKTGYVLYDMSASSIQEFAQRLGERSARELDVFIRPKSVNHISLACDRPDEEVREKVKEIYTPTHDVHIEAMQNATFDLVLSRLLKRSSFERFAEDGPHAFVEVVRIPVRCRSETEAATSDKKE